jgi:hypothetical protein
MHLSPFFRQEGDELTVSHQRQAALHILNIGMRINPPPTATLDHCVQDRAAFPGPGFFEELAIHRPPGRRLAERCDLQPADHRPSVSVGSGGLAERCAASDPDLHPGQLVRVATLELESEGYLTVEVDRIAVEFGRPSQVWNHHPLTPAWEPWVHRTLTIVLGLGLSQRDLGMSECCHLRWVASGDFQRHLLDHCDERRSIVGGQNREGASQGAGNLSGLVQLHRLSNFDFGHVWRGAIARLAMCANYVWLLDQDHDSADVKSLEHFHGNTFQLSCRGGYCEMTIQKELFLANRKESSHRLNQQPLVRGRADDGFVSGRNCLILLALDHGAGGTVLDTELPRSLFATRGFADPMNPANKNCVHC